MQVIPRSLGKKSPQISPPRRCSSSYASTFGRTTVDPHHYTHSTYARSHARVQCRDTLRIITLTNCAQMFGQHQVSGWGHARALSWWGRKAEAPCTHTHTHTHTHTQHLPLHRPWPLTYWSPSSFHMGTPFLSPLKVHSSFGEYILSKREKIFTDKLFMAKQTK